MIRQKTGHREEIVIERYQEVMPATGQIVMFEQYRLLRRTWLWVLLAAILMTAGVGLYIYSIPVEYKASTLALPPNKTGTPLDNLIGGLASSLKDFGLSRLIGGGGGDQGFSKTVLLTSHALYDSLIQKYDLYSVYEVPIERYDIMYATLDGQIDVTIDPDGPIIVDVYDTDPKRAANIANDVILFTNNLARDINRRETEPITNYVNDRTRAARKEQEDVGARLAAFMAKNKMFDPESQAPIVSSAVTEAEGNVATSRIMYELYLQTLGAQDPKTIQAEQAYRQAQEQSRRIAEGRGGVLQGPSINNLPSTAVEYLTLRQTYEVNAKVLALLEPMLEQTRFDEIRNIPILNILQQARVPAVKARPKRSMILASAFVGSLVLVYLLIALVAFFRSFRQRYQRYALLATPVSNNGEVPSTERIG